MTKILDATKTQDVPKTWNNGLPVWNKGKAMKPPALFQCSHCGSDVEIHHGSRAGRSAIYRAKTTGVAYCSDKCRRIVTAQKISATLMGHVGAKPSLEGLARRNALNTGRTPWNKGKPHSPEHLARKCAAMRTSAKAAAQRHRMHATFKGANSPHWKGGVTPAHRLIRASVDAKIWRKAVLKRDDYTCQSCGQRGGELHADHIQPFAQYPELRFVLANGRALCPDCHRRTPTYGYRGSSRTLA